MVAKVQFSVCWVQFSVARVFLVVARTFLYSSQGVLKGFQCVASRWVHQSNPLNITFSFVCHMNIVIKFAQKSNSTTRLKLNTLS